RSRPSSSSRCLSPFPRFCCSTCFVLPAEPFSECFRCEPRRGGPRSFHVGCQPVQKGLIPKLRVLRLEHPMSLVGEHHQFRRHALPLQGAEKLERLRVGNAKVALSGNHQGGGLEFPQFACIR